MKNEDVLARCNLFGVLGAIKKLVEIDEEAKELIKTENISIAFKVNNCARGVLRFENGNVSMSESNDRANISLYFSTPRKFNDLVDGKGIPMITGGYHRIGFLLNKFMKLTDILAKYLRPSEEDMKNKEFFENSTVLMLHVIAGAVAQIGNYDKIGSFSASNIVDGVIKISIGEEHSVGISVRNNILEAINGKVENEFSEMVFSDLETARMLFDGKTNAVAAVGTGKIRVFGMISQLDNLNRILDRVSVYLA